MTIQKKQSASHDTSPFDLTDQDVIGAMQEIEGYLDISVQDFRELYGRAMKLAKERFLRSTCVKDIMQSPVTCIQEAASFEQIIQILAANAVSGLPVINEDRELVGVVSEKDIFNKLAGDTGASFWTVLSGCFQSNGCMMKTIRSIQVKDIMTSPAIAIMETASVRDALQVYRDKEVNRLPVINGEGALVGIITRTDILRAHLEYEDN